MLWPFPSIRQHFQQWALENKNKALKHGCLVLHAQNTKIWHPLRCIILKKQKITSISKHVKKLETICTVSGICKLVKLLQNTVWRFFKKIKHRIHHRTQQFWRGICLAMFIPALFIITYKWKQPKWPSTDEWINKMQYVYIMEYYSAFKRKEILTHAQHGWTLRILCSIK